MKVRYDGAEFTISYTTFCGKYYGLVERPGELFRVERCIPAGGWR